MCLLVSISVLPTIAVPFSLCKQVDALSPDAAMQQLEATMQQPDAALQQLDAAMQQPLGGTAVEEAEALVLPPAETEEAADNE